MSRIAFIFGNTVIYWNSMVMALSIMIGILLFLGTYAAGQCRIKTALTVCPIAIFLSLFLGRAIHWYFCADSYDGMLDAFCSLSGSYALMGAFIGCALAAGAFSALGVEKDLLHLLDSMCIGGSVAIAVGRLACVFTAEDRGMILERFHSLPLVSATRNVATGAVEFRFATFLFQFASAILIFVFLLVSRNQALKNKSCRSGTITVRFLLLYCASQIVLDSTRYDGMHLRSNGFISAVQVVCALAMLAVLSILFLERSKQTGWKMRYTCLWSGIVLLFGGAGFMEYYVQRHGNLALQCYLIMSICVLVLACIGLGIQSNIIKVNKRASDRIDL